MDDDDDDDTKELDPTGACADFAYEWVCGVKPRREGSVVRGLPTMIAVPNDCNGSLPKGGSRV